MAHDITALWRLSTHQCSLLNDENMRRALSQRTLCDVSLSTDINKYTCIKEIFNLCIKSLLKPCLTLINFNLTPSISSIWIWYEILDIIELELSWKTDLTSYVCIFLSLMRKCNAFYYRAKCQQLIWRVSVPRKSAQLRHYRMSLLQYHISILHHQQHSI